MSTQTRSGNGALGARLKHLSPYALRRKRRRDSFEMDHVRAISIRSRLDEPHCWYEYGDEIPAARKRQFGAWQPDAETQITVAGRLTLLCVLASYRHASVSPVTSAMAVMRRVECFD